MQETPYSVTCPTHGKVFLSETQYEMQLRDAWSLWRCPICGENAPFDDAHFERFIAG